MKSGERKALPLVFGTLLLVGLTGNAMSVYAQAAGAGADFNRAERAAIQERQRLERIDPPIQSDPLGNALIGGAVTGTMRGAAAGAASALRSATLGSAVQEIRRNADENRRTGRGGPDDPRYNPATLFQR